jgi:hypothetical protein
MLAFNAQTILFNSLPEKDARPSDQNEELVAWTSVAINVRRRSLLYLRHLDSLWGQLSGTINHR